VKLKRVYYRLYEIRNEAKIDVIEYIGVLNGGCRHFNLGHVSPMELRK